MTRASEICICQIFVSDFKTFHLSPLPSPFLSIFLFLTLYLSSVLFVFLSPPSFLIGLVPLLPLCPLILLPFSLFLFLLFVGSPLGLSHHDLTFCAALQVHYVHFKFPKKGVAFEAAASTTVFGSLVSPREDFHPGLSSHGRNRFAAALSLVIFEYFLKCLSEYYFCLKLSRAV